MLNTHCWENSGQEYFFFIYADKINKFFWSKNPVVSTLLLALKKRVEQANEQSVVLIIWTNPWNVTDIRTRSSVKTMY